MLEFDKDNLPTHFCSVPWLQIHTEPNGGIFPCCYFENTKEEALGDWNNEKVVEVFTSEKWNNIRKEFVEGKKPKQCSRCWKEEDSGIMSMRQRFNERYSWFPDSSMQKSFNKIEDVVKYSNMDGTVEPELKLATIDLIFNNLCNLKCRTCGPGLSTSWIQDEIKLGRLQYNPVTLMDNGEITHMKEDLLELTKLIDPYTEIHFSGGEPMMQEDHYTFLKLLIEEGKTKVKIRYNTNLTHMSLKGVDVFDLLKEFEDVFIIGSIDAMGKKGEYIRKGFSWEGALEWIETAREKMPRANMAISAVFSALNCLEAHKLHRYMCESDLFKLNGRNFGFYLNTLHGPPWLRTTLLPKSVKDKATSEINAHIEWLLETQPDDTYRNDSIAHFRDAVTFMNSNPGSKNECIEFLRENHILDGVRNDSFEEVFPEMYEMIVDYLDE